MVYAITEMGVYDAPTLNELNKKLQLELKKEDFSFVGNDQIVHLNKDDISFVQDRKQLSQIMFHNFFRKDPRPTLFFSIQMTMLAINLAMIISIYNLIKNFLESFGV